MNPRNIQSTQPRVLSDLELDAVAGGGGPLEGISIGDIVVTGIRSVDLGYTNIGDIMGDWGMGHLDFHDAADGTAVATAPTGSNPVPAAGNGADRSFSGTGNVVVPLDIIVTATYDYDHDGNTDAFRTPSGDVWAYDVHTGNILGTVTDITVTAKVSGSHEQSMSGSVSSTVSLTPSFGGSAEGKGTVTHGGEHGVSWTINPNANQQRLYWDSPDNRYNNK